MALTKEQALAMLESDDLLGIGMEAHQLRLQKNDPRVATYQIDRNINYTNFCTEYCSFCAFYRPLGDKEGYILSFEDIYQKIDEMLPLVCLNELASFCDVFCEPQIFDQHAAGSILEAARRLGFGLLDHGD